MGPSSANGSRLLAVVGDLGRGFSKLAEEQSKASGNSAGIGGIDLDLGDRAIVFDSANRLGSSGLADYSSHIVSPTIGHDIHQPLANTK